MFARCMVGEGGLARAARREATRGAGLALLAALAGCALLPAELNLSPLYFHRLDEDGSVLEMDVLWPVVHYERTPEGGSDFRIRPIWRLVTEPSENATEHQFLWPLGRIRKDETESSQRLFPLWSLRSRVDENGGRDVDWYLLFPFVWGGSSSDGSEDYLAVLPFYADIPQFLSYDRFLAVLWPLFVRLDKGGHRHSILLWPLIGWSSCAEGRHDWRRVLPFYAQDVEAGRHTRRHVLWPLLSWSDENLDTDDPVRTFLFWPLFGYRTGRAASGWTALWPFFEHARNDAGLFKLNLFWPLFHYYENALEDHVVQWWLWPLVGHVFSDDQDAWSFLWPLIWWRRYSDPDSTTNQEWILPFFWHIHRSERESGIEDEFWKIWPLWHRSSRNDAEGGQISGDWSLLSIWPWREGNATGMEENYGWLWELARGRRRAADDDSFDLAARAFTIRRRGGRTQASVPFLFNYESSRDGGTLRLFQFLPIPIGSGEPR
ncbi:MAG: hypothetical protein Fur0037_12440 [Planctomycetota bacterium]